MIAVLLSLAWQVQAPPAYRLEPNVMIPMRDGVHLATDLYRPLTGSGPWPVVGIGDSTSLSGLMLYLSFEHPFQRR